MTFCMNIREALLRLAGDPGLNAVRPSGRGIKVNSNLKVMTVGPRGLYRFSPGFPDLIGDDWEVLSDQALTIRYNEILRQQAATAEAE